MEARCEPFTSLMNLKHHHINNIQLMFSIFNVVRGDAHPTHTVSVHSSSAQRQFM